MMLSIIRTAANKVFQQLGKGHSEKIYHKALGYELAINGFNITNEYHVPIKYIDSMGVEHILESERIDIFIHNYKDVDKHSKNVILELKAISKTIQDQERNQVMKYIRQLKDIHFSHGIVINFPQSFNRIHEEVDFIVVQTTN